MNGNRHDNNQNNLAYGTPKQNGEDTARYGGLKGSKNPISKINETIAIRIREKRKEGMTVDEIAKTFNCSHGIVDNVINMRSWQNV